VDFFQLIHAVLHFQWLAESADVEPQIQFLFVYLFSAGFWYTHDSWKQSSLDTKGQLYMQAKECQGLPVSAISTRDIRENIPGDISISDFQLPELWGNTFSLFSLTRFFILCYGSPRKLIYLLKVKTV